MRITLGLSTLLLGSSVFAQSDVPSEVIDDADHNPNYTQSVPFQVGDKTWNVRLNITEIHYGYNQKGISDPRYLSTSYEVLRPSDWKSGDAAVWIPDKDGSDGLKLFLTGDPFTADATNAYDANKQGDCTPVVGEDCMKALRATNYSNPFTDDPNGPKACKDVRTRYALFASTSFLSEPLTAMVSDEYNVSDKDVLQTELERVHMMILTGNETNIICTRFKNDKVKKGDPGTGNSGSSLTPKGWLPIAIVGALFYFL